MLIYAVVIWVVVLQSADAACAPSRVNCRSNNSYTFCVDLGYTTVKLESVNLKCPDGLVCSEKHYYPCVPESEVLPIGGLPEPVTTTTPVIITTTQETPDTSPTTTQTQTMQVTTKTINETLIPPTQSQSTTQLIPITTTLTPFISTINSTDAVPSTLNPTLLPSSQSPTTAPTIIHTTIPPTLTTISIINSTTAVPPIINSTLIPSTLIPLTQSQSTTKLISITTTLTPFISTINSTDAVPSTPNPTLLPSSQSPTTAPIIIQTTIPPTLTTISIINSTTAVPPIINSTLIPSITNPSTLIPSTQSQSTSIEDTTAPVVTAPSPVTTTQVPTLPPCPNPLPGDKPTCKISGTTSPGSICINYYECVPIWFGLEVQEKTCAKGRAYSASQGKCVQPPLGCLCSN